MLNKKETLEKLRNDTKGLPYPEYILALKEIGVSHYQMNVGNHDLHFIFDDNEIVSFPGDEFSIENENSFSLKDVAVAVKEFHEEITTYPEFLLALADCGVQRYIVDLNQMKATYAGAAEGDIYTELIRTKSDY